MREDSIYITDEDGKEYEMRIYLTFDYNDKQFAILYNEAEQDNLYLFVYDDEGNIYQSEDENELAMAQEVIDAYEEEN